MSSARDAASARRRPSLWGWLVTVSACLLVGVGVMLVVWWGTSSHTRTSGYDVKGTVSAVNLDLGSADAEIVGGAETSTLKVERTDRYSFGRDATASRNLVGDVLNLRSRCPDALVARCDAAYRLTVPANVAVTVTTTSGNVTFTGYRGTARIATTSGDVVVSGYCGFSLQARTNEGDAHVATVCAPERLLMRTSSGDASALVPPGRYRVDASSNTGAHRVRGLEVADDSQFQIQIVTNSGDATVDAAS